MEFLIIIAVIVVIVILVKEIKDTSGHSGDENITASSTQYDENVYYAKQGDPMAMENLAIFLWCGEKDYGYPIDKEQSVFWLNELLKLAAGGNLLAQSRIVDMTYVTKVVAASLSETQFNSLKSAYSKSLSEQAEKGNKDALYGLSEPERDDDKRFALCQKAAEAGSALACYDLHRYYTLGGFFGNDQSKRDKAKALSYLQKGSAFDDYYACRCQYMIAIGYRNGDSGEISQQKYDYWLKMAADNGCFQAKQDLCSHMKVFS